MNPNSPDALRTREHAGALTWRGPAMMLFARSAFAIGAQALTAGAFVLLSSPEPWRASGDWLPVYGTLIDAGCVALLWQLTRREGIRLFDLLNFDRSRLGRDVLLGFALVPPSLVFIFAGVYAAGWIVYGTLKPPLLLGSLPLPAALYAALVWPFIWGLTEQMTYNGYLVSRFQVLFRKTGPAVAIAAFAWSFQHVVMPLTLDPQFMTFRLLSSVPHSLFDLLLYLRLRRLIPFAIAHALMDGGAVLLPLLSR